MPIRLAICANTQGARAPADAATDYAAEWDTPSTLEAVARALRRCHIVLGIVEADVYAFDVLRRLQPDMVFNMAEGAGGRDREGRLPSMLEMLGVPYTGSDPVTLGISLDKALCNRLLRASGVAVPQLCTAYPGEPLPTVSYPAVVKPLHEGSSIGIRASSLVHSLHELRQEVCRIHHDHRQPAVIEEFLGGREFTVALLGNGRHVEVLPIVEILLHNLPADLPRLYSYEAKWLYDTPAQPLPIHACPAPLAPDLHHALVEGSKRAFAALGCRDWCRVDWRCDTSGQPYVLEVNPLPGIIPEPAAHSGFPAAARAAGMTFDDLVLAVLNAAVQRYGIG